MRDPKLTQQEWDKLVDGIKLCGANRGPHDYIPIVTQKTKTADHVTTFMCRVCFKRLGINTILEVFE